MRLLCLAVAVCLSLCGCVKPEEKLLNPVNAADTSSDVVIGAALPLTGRYAGMGSEMLNGIECAVDMLNNNRGIAGKRVRLEIRDTAGSPEGAAAAMNAFASGAVNAVVGGCSDAENETLAQKAEELRIPLMIACGTADTYSGQGRFVYRVTSSDIRHAEGLSSYLIHWRQLDKMAILSNTGDARTGNMARITAQSFTDSGGTLLVKKEYSSAEERTAAMRGVLIYAPQIIMISAGGKEAAEMIRFLRSAGFAGVICGTDNWDSAEFFKTLGSKEDPGECCYVTSTSKEYKDDEAWLFAETFCKKYHHQPGTLAVNAADAVKMFAGCLGGNTQDIRKLKRNWVSIRNFFGAASMYNAFSDGSADRMIFINGIVPPGVADEYPAPRLIRHFLYSKLENYNIDR